MHGFGLGTMREDTQWARPVASDFVEYAVIGLLQRIRPRAQAPAKMEIRASRSS